MITVKLFGPLRERAGKDNVILDISEGTVSSLLELVAKNFPALSGFSSSGRIIVAVNQEFVREDDPVKSGDEVALMPPFSGGEGLQGCVRIQTQPFSLDAEIERIKGASRSIGGIVTFLGTTRDLSRGTAVTKLEFEHYPGMAEKKLAEIRERALKEFGVIDATIIHRTGTLPVSENIVLIVVAAAHRDEAFRACRFCIDELKRITPIWKKETTRDGVVWVEAHP
jgi:molybdopterin converting factor subunit 1